MNDSEIAPWIAQRHPASQVRGQRVLLIIPDGTRTAKAEMDDVAAAGDHAARMRLRRRVEDA